MATKVHANLFLLRCLYCIENLLMMTYFQTFKTLHKYHVTRVVLDCHSDRILQYVAEAEAANLVNEYEVRAYVSKVTK